MIHRISVSEIKQLVATPEQPKLDLKADLRLDNDHLKAEFVKDVVAVANSPGETGFLLYGVDSTLPDPIVGISRSFDDATLQQMVNSKVERPVAFLYYEQQFDARKVGVVVIPPSSLRPHIVGSPIGNLKEGQIPIRRGSSTTWATAEDLAEMNAAHDSSRPTFERTNGAIGGIETSFSPSWRIRQASGDYVANVEWRFRGPRFHMVWRVASGAALEGASIAASFDLGCVPGDPDEHVELNEIGLEIRFHWRGRCWHELHRWPITRRVLPNKVLWDVGEEILPPIYWNE